MASKAPYIPRSRTVLRDGDKTIQQIFHGDLPRGAKPPPPHDDIRKWLGEKLPSHDRCVDRIHEAISEMCTSVPIRDAMPHDEMRQFLASIQTQKRVLPMLIGTYGRFRRGQMLAQMLTVFLGMVEAIATRIGPPQRLYRYEAWHADATWLHGILQEEAREVVPVSSNGPCSKFLQQAMLYIWGRTLEEDAIRRAIERF